MVSQGCEKVFLSSSDNSREKFKPTGFLHNSTPLVPNKRSPSELESFRCSLPIHKYQDEIVNLIKTNKVVLVVGENGSGKTTQVGTLTAKSHFKCFLFKEQDK